MPMVSKAQNAAMHAAAQGKSTIGIPEAVAEKFVQASHGEDVKALPKRIPHPKGSTVVHIHLHAE